MFSKYLSRILLLSLILSVLSLTGCLDKSLTFQIRFTELNNLQQGDQVLFQSNSIGEVTGINYTEHGDYLVAVTIMPNFTNATTENSAFHIATDPENPRAKAVFVEQVKPGGTVIEKGTVVSGVQKKSYLDDLIRDLKEKAETAESEFKTTLKDLEESLNAQSQALNQSLHNTLQELSRQFESIKDEVQNVPNREEVKELEKNIQEFVEDFKNAQKDVQDKLQNEVIPQLRMELEKLREQLQKEGREEELEKIDEEMNGVITI